MDKDSALHLQISNYNHSIFDNSSLKLSRSPFAQSGMYCTVLFTDLLNLKSMSSMTWSLFPNLPTSSAFRKVSWLLTITKSRILPLICVGKSMHCVSRLSLALFKNNLPFLSLVFLLQSIPGRFMSPISTHSDFFSCSSVCPDRGSHHFGFCT